MEMKTFDESKLSLAKVEGFHVIRHKNQPLDIIIPRKCIKSYHTNRFDDSKIDFVFTRDVHNIFSEVDLFMTSKLKNPDSYKPVNKKWMSARCEEDLENRPIHHVIFSIGNLWKFNEEVGLKLGVKIIYDDKKPAQPVEMDDDLFYN